MDGRRHVAALDARFPPELASVVAARRLVQDAAADWGVGEATAQNAALAMSELVTNAVLHAGTEIGVSVCRLGRGMRLEVRDGSSRLPVVGVERVEDLLSTRSMTGRGLALLSATADRWGADEMPGGKVMWAEVGTGRRPVEDGSRAQDGPGHPASRNAAPGRARTALAGARRAEPVRRPTRDGARAAVPARSGAAATIDGRVPVFAAVGFQAAANGDGIVESAGVTAVTAIAAEGRRVHLVGVPVRLLVESARQFADLQREMQVIALSHNGNEDLGEVADAGRELSASIATLGDAGAEVAQAAFARGEARVDFDVVVPETAQPIFERLAVLLRRVGESLAHHQLLTMPPSEEVAAYRHWYREEVTYQLAGRPPRPCPFESAASY